MPASDGQQTGSSPAKDGRFRLTVTPNSTAQLGEVTANEAGFKITVSVTALANIFKKRAEGGRLQVSSAPHGSKAYKSIFLFHFDPLLPPEDYGYLKLSFERRLRLTRGIAPSFRLEFFRSGRTAAIEGFAAHIPSEKFFPKPSRKAPAR